MSRHRFNIDVEIRRLSIEDESEVLRAHGLLDEPPDPGAVRSYLSDSRNVFFMAYDGSTPVGFLRGTELEQLRSPRRQMFLYEISVEESHRRRGIGKKLVQALLEYCRVRGFEEVFVFTDDPANAAAHRLYLSAGGATETEGERMYVFRL